MGISSERFVYHSLIIQAPDKIAKGVLLTCPENHVLPTKSTLSTPPPTGKEAPVNDEISSAGIGHRAGGFVGASVQCGLKPLPVLPASVRKVFDHQSPDHVTEE